MRYIIGTIGIAVGVLLLWKTYAIVQALGAIPWVEQKMGSGGTYTFYKLVGMTFVILFLLYMFGHFSFTPPTFPTR